MRVRRPGGHQTIETYSLWPLRFEVASWRVRTSSEASSMPFASSLPWNVPLMSRDEWTENARVQLARSAAERGRR